MTKGILTGRKVLEMGSMIAAPFATHILGQLGAEVIKVEPLEGDTTRRLVRGGPSGTYIAYNRNKRSLCLNLRTDEGQEALRRLVAEVDIVVHNLSPGAARRLNVGYEAFSAINSDIIYCHIKGYAQGPLSEEIASNPIAEAASGVMYYNRVEGRPSRLGPSYLDQFAGSYAVIGVLSALLDPAGGRERREIEIGLYETGLHVAARELVGVQLKSQLLGRPEVEPSPEFSIPGYGAYETRDGRWVYLVMLSDDHWRRLCSAVGIVDDPNLATLRQRRKHRPQVEKLVAGAIGRQSFDEVTEELTKAKIGHTEVLPAHRVLETPQATTPPKFTEVPFSGFLFQCPGFPVPASSGEADSMPSVPLLGQDTDAILSELGYGSDKISALIDAGAAARSQCGAKLWAVPSG